jgi:hypothetical protein
MVKEKLRKGNGVRFKVLGDGKTWLLRFQTIESRITFAHYQAKIQTKKNKVIQIDIPFSKLKHPGYGKKDPFIKNNILNMLFEYNSSTENKTRFTVMKVFDFEIY